MKTIKKNLITVSGLILAAALFFSCDNPVPPVLPETPASGETSTTAANPAGGAGGSSAGGGAGGAAASGSGAAANLTPGTLPENVGTDPFAGRAYRFEESQMSYYNEFSFSNDGILTYVVSQNGQISSGYKYQYRYNANNKELSIKQTERYFRGLNGVFAWHTYNQEVDVYNGWTYSLYLSTNQSGQTMTEQEFNQQKQSILEALPAQYEKITVYKAEEDFFQNLKLRTSYYKTAPATLPASEMIQFTATSGIAGYLIVYPSGYNNSILWPTSNPQQIFLITNISSDTITAAEANGNYTLVSGGQQLQINYSNFGLGNDNNLVITLTGADSTTSTAFTNWFGSNSITLSTYTQSATYTWQDNGAAPAPTYNVPAWPANAESGTCPFSGHTYSNASGSSSTSYGTYTFGANNTLTYSWINNNNQSSGTKWEYKYNATTKELCLKITHIWMNINGTYNWRDYTQIYNYCRSTGNETTFNNYKNQFENLTYYKADEESSNLKLRTDNYFITPPSSLPSERYLNFINNTAVNGKSVNLNISSQGNQSNPGSFGIYQNSGNSYYKITNITSNTITVAEATQTNGNYTLVSGGQQLQFAYSNLSVGTDNSLVITLSGSNTATKNYLKTLLNTNQDDPSITLMTYTGSAVFTLQS